MSQQAIKDALGFPNMTDADLESMLQARSRVAASSRTCDAWLCKLCG